MVQCGDAAASAACVAASGRSPSTLVAAMVAQGCPAAGVAKRRVAVNLQCEVGWLADGKVKVAWLSAVAMIAADTT